MAACALATGLEPQTAVRGLGLGMEPRVALQAELSSLAPDQQHAIGTPMRSVADRAAFHPDGGVLVNVGPALFHVALYAGLSIGSIQARAIDAAVRVMAVGTFEHPFRHAVMDRKRELGLNVSVTRKAEIGLRLL